MKKTVIKVKNLNKNEVLFVSVAAGLIVSILLGSIFPASRYYNVIHGVKIEVGSGSGVEVHEFNYLLAIVSQTIVSSIIYFYIKSKRNEN